MAQLVLAEKQIDFDIAAKGNVAASELASHPAVGITEAFRRIH